MAANAHKTEHSGAKNGHDAGFRGTRAEAKRISNAVRRNISKKLAKDF